MNTTHGNALVIAPIGSADSKLRRSTDGLIRAVLRPMLTRHGLQTIVAHEITEPGSIGQQVLELLLSADLLVADLTGLNPNVMYELAIRHATCRPVIILAEAGTKLPFDIADERVLFYINDMAGVEELGARVDEYIHSALHMQEAVNPVYRALATALFAKSAAASTVDGHLLQQLSLLTDRVGLVYRSVQTSLPFQIRDSATHHLRMHGPKAALDRQMQTLRNPPRDLRVVQVQRYAYDRAAINVRVGPAFDLAELVTTASSFGVEVGLYALGGQPPADQT